MMGTVCTNRTRTKDKWDKYTFGQCGRCRYLYTHRGDHWLDDAVRCDAPCVVECGDEIIHVKPYVKKKKKARRALKGGG